MSRVIHFDMTAKNPERASKFYSNIFDWKIEKFDGPDDYWVITTGEDDEPGINGGLMSRAETDVSSAYSISVTSVDDCLEKVEKNGGIVVGTKKTIPGVGYFAYCEDTEDNAFGIVEWDADAK
jgi:predicted enzyme related to lactoylglutathione lyase